ncbi:protein shuttle craft isoform X2 [Ostrinia furnacalis]|uniref:protein shuttle craft isoform X2 n=1 Tax=Ostrinia furnacalis TaxID=93504 RepID=UPI00103EF6EE|nr:protein shuttle craft isoform X2 [Ostrinia furnacalis]
MSQWNNSYVYNNQYQGENTWNGDLNTQYANQGYYPNPNQQYDSANQQYVSFNEFINQMQGNGAPQPSANNYNSSQYQNYGQYDYQNMPSTSQNSQVDSYYAGNSSNSQNGAESYNQSQYEQQPQEQASYSNELILKSNLTPTASEFVPKSTKAKPSRSVQNVPETTNSNSSNNGATEYKKSHGSSSDTNWRERPQSSQQNGETKHNSRYQDNYRHQENSNRNRDRDRDRNRYQDSNSHNYESNNRPDRNQSKSNGKSKKQDADGLTFYNSSINKRGQDHRNGKGEGSGRNRNWAGSQRLRAERNYTEDEQYANSYLQYKEEKAERLAKQDNPSPKFRNKQTAETAHTEMTQRERLSEQLDKGTLECLVCCERVKQIDPVWSCGNCYHVLHLRCIRKWAMSSVVEGKWRCPACQNTSEEIPTEYRCMCGATRAPEYQRGGSGAHTCGKACKRPRACPHPCTLLCHPGPCPPCQATVSKKCGCGAETRSVLCSSKLPQVCGRTCHKTLTCGAHACQAPCHEGACQDCEETVTQVCYCPAAKSRSVPCTRETGSQQQWSCGSACARVLACGRHVCTLACHAPPCAPCRLLPRLVLTCPCGKNKLDKDSRKSCTDPIPLCGGICAKPLPCGPAGDKHFCKLDCHEGECPVCPDKTLVQCRCGHSSREVPCAELPQMINNVLCQKKCNKKLSCGRHRCRTVCCAASSHRCAVVCARTLSCQLHRCEEFCHTGHCAPCPRVSFEELRCTCGAQVLLPPVRCGARPPACDAPCRRRRACLHPPHHSCHTGDCPPCVVLTTKRCHGQHEERKTIPCSQDEFSCGLPCGKPLPCGKHTCIKTCHKGECDTSKCTQPCNEKRPSCGHPCAAPCHSGTGAPCPSAAPCRRPVRATCACGRRSADRACADNARDYNKMMSALAATKMQEGGSVDLSDVQRPGSMLKTLDCDDECRVEARTRQMALALQIRNPDVSAKLAPRYSDTLRATAAREPAFAQQIHDKLTELVHLAKKSKQKTRAHSFPSMNWQKRQFIHELCEHFGCESVAYDAEPNRNVVATADREKSWLPAMSILEVVQREAGKRKVPGPVLRPPAASSAAAAAAGNKPSGWATLTSTNAWAARSQPKPQPQPPPQDKLDYFDYPPDN